MSFTHLYFIANVCVSEFIYFCLLFRILLTQFLPPVLRRLMCDPYSPIIDFYPTEFEIDMNGKKNAWEGIALIPFADERRLKEVRSMVCTCHAPLFSSRG